MASTTISIRTDSKLKKEAQKILSGYGLTLSSAFNMYMNDVRMKRVEPTCQRRFVPDNIMHKWQKEADEAIKNGRRFSSIKELMTDLAA